MQITGHTTFYHQVDQYQCCLSIDSKMASPPPPLPPLLYFMPQYKYPLSSARCVRVRYSTE